MRGNYTHGPVAAWFAAGGILRGQSTDYTGPHGYAARRDVDDHEFGGCGSVRCKVSRDVVSKRRVESVLDAGSGHGLPFRLPNGARVTGLDVSEASLAENHLLDARIVSAVETYPLPPELFDTVVCWNVLEHLPRPITALSN